MLADTGPWSSTKRYILPRGWFDGIPSIWVKRFDIISKHCLIAMQSILVRIHHCTSRCEDRSLSIFSPSSWQCCIAQSNVIHDWEYGVYAKSCRASSSAHTSYLEV